MPLCGCVSYKVMTSINIADKLPFSVHMHTQIYLACHTQAVELRAIVPRATVNVSTKREKNPSFFLNERSIVWRPAPFPWGGSPD